MVDVSVLENDAVVAVVTTVAAQTVYAFDFLATDAEQMVAVFEDISTGIKTDLVSGVDFTVSGINQANGGDITLTSIVSEVGDIVTIYRSIPIRRLFDYAQSGDFRADVINGELDLITMMIQEVRRDVDRSVKTPIGGALIVEFPDPEVGKVVMGNAAGDGFENGPTASEIAGAQQAALDAQAALAQMPVSMSAYILSFLGVDDFSTAQKILRNQAKVQTISADHTLLVTDRSDTFIATADLTITLLAGATAVPEPDAGFHFFFNAKGGVIYLDGSGAETVNGVAIKTIQDGETGRMDWDPTAGEWLCTILHRKSLRNYISNALLDTSNDFTSPVVVDSGHEIKLAAGEVVDFRVFKMGQARGLGASYVSASVSVTLDVTAQVVGAGSAFNVFGEAMIASYKPTTEGGAAINHILSNITSRRYTLTGPGTFTFSSHDVQSNLSGAETVNVGPHFIELERITDD